MNNYFSLENKWVIRSIFLVLLTYLFLRAFLLPPYIDEIYTLNEYIEPSILWENSLNSLSANNHLLNTYLAALFHFFFKDNFFFLRIPNILGFVLFYISLKYIIQNIIHKSFQLIVFISLLTISWIVEYFAYLRGYGLALGCFFTAISFFMKWKETKETKKFTLFLLFLFLSYFSNLSFFNSLILFTGYSIGYVFFTNKDFKKNQKIQLFISYVVFLFFVIILVNYSFKLKEAGALWWGNLSGIWNCTGLSISDLTFYFPTVSLFIPVLIFLILLLVIGFFDFIKNGLKKFLTSNDSLFFTLLFGNLLVIELLAIFFRVNYPHDRAAMQLVLFSIIVFSLTFQRIKYLKYLLIILVYFPITFIVNASVYTSIYQKNHRISPAIKEYIDRHIKDDKSYSVFPLIEQSINYALRSDSVAKFFSVNKDASYLETNYLFVDKDSISSSIPSYYKKIFEDKYTNIALFENTHNATKHLIEDTFIKQAKSTNEFLDLLKNETLNSKITTGKYSIKICGDVKFSKRPSKLNLVVAVGDSINPLKYYGSSELMKLTSDNYIKFDFNSPFYKLDEMKTNLSVYFWNIDKELISYYNIRLKLYEIR